jgi:predicted N-acetyltransferase YhbS
MITYRTGNNLNLDAVIELYRASALGERRPIGDRERMERMLDHANLVVTAWDGELLVGISRALTDFVYVTYLSDLAVRASHQRHGIGKALIQRTQSAAPQAQVVLLAAPAAESYYPHVGFTHHPQAWLLKPDESIRV